MFTLLKHLNPRTVAIEAPSLIASLFVTDYYCHFHSFALECVAFLSFWSLGSFVVNKLVKRSD
ncbi:hypothetical protein GCM10028818_60390 [Spirosoma horti]